VNLLKGFLFLIADALDLNTMVAAVMSAFIFKYFGNTQEE
jgi:hypothetical protein